jgi:4-hydroxy-tetrahydrodipicolinate synthase
MDQLKGMGVALVTPFLHDCSIDFEALHRVIDFTIANGANYVVTLGTTGETATLSTEEKLKILAYTYDAVAGRVPVVVGIGGNNTAEVLHCIASWPLGNAAAVLSVSPYYSKPSQAGIFAHYAAIAEACAKPVLLYNVPGRTGSNITAANALALAARYPNIVGIKEASGAMGQAMHLIKDRPKGFLLISGDDLLTLPLMACGFDGVISVVGNCFPAEFSRLVKLAEQSNFAEAGGIQQQLVDAIDLLFVENNPAGAKAFLAAKGLCHNVLRLPLVPLSEVVHRQVLECLAKF